MYILTPHHHTTHHFPHLTTPPLTTPPLTASPYPSHSFPFLPMMQYQECDKVITEYKELMEKARLKAEEEEKLKQMAIKVCMCVLQYVLGPN